MGADEGLESITGNRQKRTRIIVKMQDFIGNDLDAAASATGNRSL